ncbi:hypothetical protein SFC76_03080 [Sphingomonas sp. CD22]|uniref:hypothetical protein n=1 Tax=Sphingomonas sp. CD22 TaxID=3100214 RepID=UPI002ADFCF4B|nr:hypothetical protein [Sphingomonas sp. CD22]MEA1083232.1 hypothetical protein [Sphingomonas sp. CD22]
MSRAPKETRSSKIAKEETRREGVLADRVRAGGSPFDPASLARSYALPVDRGREIITRNGGRYA